MPKTITFNELRSQAPTGASLCSMTPQSLTWLSKSLNKTRRRKKKKSNTSLFLETGKTHGIPTGK